jgi:multidrug resistance protein, MATE family
VLCYVVWLRDGFHGWAAWPGWPRVGEVFRLGLPAALQISLEVAVFAGTTTMMGRLGAVALGGHQIALTVASVTYMVPLGISSAAAVRVGQAIGRQDPAAARLAGWVATGLGALFMLAAGVVLWVVPHWIARAFTPDAEVVATAVALLAIAAWFQLFDGIQAVATGALRGLGDTKTAMFTHVSIYWGIGLPLGYWLAFPKNLGPAGLWTGLCVSLILIGFILLAAWHRQSRYPASIRA